MEHRRLLMLEHVALTRQRRQRSPWDLTRALAAYRASLCPAGAAGLWPKAPTRTRPGRTYDSSPAIHRRVRDHMGPASRRDARIPPAINPKFRSSLRGRDQILNTSTGDKSSAYFLVVPPGHTATATALNAEMSKLQAPKAKGREITWSKCLRVLPKWNRVFVRQRYYLPFAKIVRTSPKLSD